jgi:hypothetical protein
VVDGYCGVGSCGSDLLPSTIGIPIIEEI